MSWLQKPHQLHCQLYHCPLSRRGAGTEGLGREESGRAEGGERARRSQACERVGRHPCPSATQLPGPSTQAHHDQTQPEQDGGLHTHRRVGLWLASAEECPRKHAAWDPGRSGLGGLDRCSNAAGGCRTPSWDVRPRPVKHACTARTRPAPHSPIAYDGDDEHDEAACGNVPFVGVLIHPFGVQIVADAAAGTRWRVEQVGG